MPSHSDLPSDISRKKLARALQRLGFIINTKGGKGSHFKAIFARTQKSITMSSKINKSVLVYILKEIEEYSEITWDEIKKQL